MHVDKTYLVRRDLCAVQADLRSECVEGRNPNIGVELVLKEKEMRRRYLLTSESVVPLSECV